MYGNWLEKLVIFREHHGTSFIRTVLAQKIRYQYTIIGNQGRSLPYCQRLSRATPQQCLLIEARAAKQYWKLFGDSLQNKVLWQTRTPHGNDPTNTLLDIGYHYITQRTSKLFKEIHMPSDLGIFHRAQHPKAEPLVYDFIEWMRAPLVEKTVLTLLRRKKILYTEVRKHDIQKMILNIQQGYEKKYHSRTLGYCINFEYWTRLIALELRGAAREGRPFAPHFPSLRHETRCTEKKNRPEPRKGRNG